MVQDGVPGLKSILVSRISMTINHEFLTSFWISSCESHMEDTRYLLIRGSFEMYFEG